MKYFFCKPLLTSNIEREKAKIFNWTFILTLPSHVNKKIQEIKSLQQLMAELNEFRSLRGKK